MYVLPLVHSTGVLSWTPPSVGTGEHAMDEDDELVSGDGLPADVLALDDAPVLDEDPLATPPRYVGAEPPITIGVPVALETPPSSPASAPTDAVDVAGAALPSGVLTGAGMSTAGPSEQPATAVPRTTARRRPLFRGNLMSCGPRWRRNASVSSVRDARRSGDANDGSIHRQRRVLV
jgi:hypothetical protein